MLRRKGFSEEEERTSVLSWRRGKAVETRPQHGDARGEGGADDSAERQGKVKSCMGGTSNSSSLNLTTI